MPGTSVSRGQYFELVTTASVLIGAVALVWLLVERWWTRDQPAASALPGPQKIEGAKTKGDSGAAVGIMIFSDFECPFCAALALRTLPTIEKRYVSSGKVLLAFRHFPLPIHRSGWFAAQAAECAGREGRFWQMHDLLFAGPRQVEKQDMLENARTLGLSAGFARCLDGEAVDSVNADISAAAAAGGTATPLLLLGPLRDGKQIEVMRSIVGLPTLADLSETIDAILTSR